MRHSRSLRGGGWVVGWTAALVFVTGVAAAHSGTLRSATPDQLAVPTWLYLATGGGAVGASFLLASFVTDRAFVGSVHGWHRRLPTPRGALVLAGRAVGVAGLAAVLALGAVGPVTGTRNGAVLLVWVVWWAGYAMTIYLVGNTWPVVNPWRTIADLLPAADRPYPSRLAAWPAVAGLLALVWIEIVSPLADDPRLLAGVVAVYSAVTLVGATRYGPDTWFGRVDPVARVFRLYGRVAPVQRTDDGVRLRLPGSALTEARAVDAAFVVALLWATTYDGLVGTPAWADAARWAVGLGVPPALLYPAALVAGFGFFYGVYLLAARATRRTAPTYLAADTIARRFAASLLPIAAGYHLAHFLAYFLALAPAAVTVLFDPLSPVQNPPVLVVPGWILALPLWYVLVGHVLAVWVAHAVAYDLFPGRLQAVRSQYPLALVMIGYTITSLWIVSQPTASPPFL